MKIQIQNIKCKNIRYLDYKAQKDRNNLRDLKKICIVRLNCNSIDVDVLKANTKYYNVKTEYFKANGRDSLFVDLIGKNHDIIRLFIKYNNILDGLTYKEQDMLKYIKNNSYISKKYNYYDDIPDNEYGIYEPIKEIDDYNNYDNYYNQSVFKNKRINYDNKNNIKQDVVSKILEQACNLITDFKLSVIDEKINCFKDNKLDYIAIFNYMIGKKEKKLKTYYKVAQNEGVTYNNYNEFIKCVVCYGASYPKNNRFWREVKRELY